MQGEDKTGTCRGIYLKGAEGPMVDWERKRSVMNLGRVRQGRIKQYFKACLKCARKS